MSAKKCQIALGKTWSQKIRKNQTKGDKSRYVSLLVHLFAQLNSDQSDFSHWINMLNQPWSCQQGLTSANSWLSSWCVRALNLPGSPKVNENMAYHNKLIFLSHLYAQLNPQRRKHSAWGNVCHYTSYFSTFLYLETYLDIPFTSLIQIL